MSDPISRDKAVAAVLATSMEYQLIYGKKEPKEGFVRSLIKSIANIPQEETERKHGKWIPHEDEYGEHYGDDCSECGEWYVMPFGKLNYCPGCGARMDEGQKESRR